MPELPEVETVARQLDPLVRGRRVLALECYDPLLEAGPAPALGSRGWRLARVCRRGKLVVFELEPPRAAGEPRSLGVHLRMTGRLHYEERDEGSPLPHLRARVLLDRGALRFFDVRRFGTLRWLPAADALALPGRDPLVPPLRRGELRALLGESRQELKAWLLRQDRLIGIGNIYASEILFEAGLSPFREAGSLDDDEVTRLGRITRRVLERAIRHCGTTFSDFQDAYGVTGSYQEKLRVYGKEGDACPRCGEPIVRVVQQQRSTFYCPRCVGERPGRRPSGVERKGQRRARANEGRAKSGGPAKTLKKMEPQKKGSRAKGPAREP